MQAWVRGAGRRPRPVHSHSCGQPNFCVLRVKARGQGDLITFVSHAAMIWAGEFVRPSGSWTNDRTHGVQFRVGIILTAGTLVLCPWLGRAKQRVGERLGSRATYVEGTQNVLCAILAGAVLVGLAANTLFAEWWIDPAIALVIAAACVREGQKAWRGKGCGCATCS